MRCTPVEAFFERPTIFIPTVAAEVRSPFVVRTMSGLPCAAFVLSFAYTSCDTKTHFPCAPAAMDASTQMPNQPYSHSAALVWTIVVQRSRSDESTETSIIRTSPLTTASVEIMVPDSSLRRTPSGGDPTTNWLIGLFSSGVGDVDPRREEPARPQVVADELREHVEVLHHRRLGAHVRLRSLGVEHAVSVHDHAQVRGVDDLEPRTRDGRGLFRASRVAGAL